MERLSVARLAVLLGLVWLGCTSDVPVEPSPAPSGGPVKVAFQGEPADASTSAALPPIQIAIVDAQDHVVPRDGIDITLRLAPHPGAATLRGTLTAPTRAGVAEFSNVWIDQAADGYRLIAEVSALSADTSRSFNIAAGRPFDRSIIAAGGSSTCALDRSGAAWCWGDNELGQLGEGRVFSSSRPGPIAGDLRLSQISVYPGSGSDAGEQSHVNRGPGAVAGEYIGAYRVACGLTASGAIHCWGGDGSPINGSDAATPQPLAGAPAFSSIGTGIGRECGLALDGTVWCWTVGSSVDWQWQGPSQLATDLRFSGLAVGGRHECGLTDAGQAYCWGTGALGNGGETPFDTRVPPVPVSGDHVFGTISAGAQHTCGIDQAGVAWCWGYFHEGNAVGDSSTTPTALVPMRVGGHAFRSISAGGRHTCALDDAGLAWCWGVNAFGQRGDGSANRWSPAYAPVAVSGGHAFATISAGGRKTCALTSDGEAWCWGEGSWGQIGDGEQVNRYVPTRVLGTERFAAISAGADVTCAITTDGEGRCWGSNNAGELGDGHPARSPIPVRVAGGKTFKSLSGGGEAMCGLTSSGETWCWGNRQSSPLRLTGDPGFTVMSMDGGAGCGIDAEYQAWCWGFGTAPVRVAGSLRLTAIAAGAERCALTSGGDVYCWDPWDLQKMPVLVEGGLKFVAITGGSWSGAHCGLTAAGTAYCWGINWGGQLGTGTSDNTTVPLPVVGGLRFSSISAGQGITCGVTVDRQGYCWYADPNNTGINTPQPVPGNLTFTRIEVSRGYGRHACGTTQGGTIYCWGSNQYGQLGNGQFDSVPVTVPTPVVGLQAPQP